jgi:hypothetical protein
MQKLVYYIDIKIQTVKNLLTFIMITARFINLLQTRSIYERVLRQAEITACSSDLNMPEK